MKHCYIKVDESNRITTVENIPAHEADVSEKFEGTHKEFAAMPFCIIFTEIYILTCGIAVL